MTGKRKETILLNSLSTKLGAGRTSWSIPIGRGSAPSYWSDQGPRLDASGPYVLQWSRTREHRIGPFTSISCHTQTGL